jgi:DNA modification methylase
MSSRIINADVIDGLRQLPDGHFQCCATSPPFWGLRNYNVDGQIGLEPTLSEYLDRLVSVFGEVRRVLREDGVCFVEIGDTYNGYMANQRATSISANNQHSRPFFEQGHGPRTRSLKPKDLCLVPQRLAISLQAAGWYVRSDIIWSRPNPMPESCRDRPTKSHSYVWLLTKSPRYFWDQEAVREKHNPKWIGRYEQPFNIGKKEKLGAGRPEGNSNTPGMKDLNPAGRNIRSVWHIPTQSFPDAHFATFPEALVERCLKAGTSSKGCCPECGTPWARVVEISGGTIGQSWHSHDKDSVLGHRCTNQGRDGGSHDPNYRRQTTGWRPGCDCNADPVPCRVLDCFAGAGTVGVVAKKMGLDFTGIELNPEYCEMARRRIECCLREPHRQVESCEGQRSLF